MQVIRAQAMGMCFGVRDALTVARGLPHPERTTIYGELVHNEVVRAELAARGFVELGEGRRSPVRTTPRVLVTAHGISNREREQLVNNGRVLVDTTCPLVRKAHDNALALAAEGFHVVVLGRKGHVEVQGLVGDLDDWTVVESLADVAPWAHSRLGVVSQTTLQETDVHRLLLAIDEHNPDAEVVYRDTVCEPTKSRQRAMEELLPRVDAVVVVGGRNSNNTRQLVAVCAAAGRPAFHVQGPEGVDLEALRPFTVVGLTAGTSTPDEVIDAVESRLLLVTPTSAAS